MAGAHFSLLKSPQPGMNISQSIVTLVQTVHHPGMTTTNSMLIIVLFTFVCLPYLLSSLMNTTNPPTFRKFVLCPHWLGCSITLYGFKFSRYRFFANIQYVIITALPWAPLIHLFGFLPQVNTLVMYLLEQLNIHLFGGSGELTSFLFHGLGTANLGASVFDFARSVLIVAGMGGIAYAAELSQPTLLSFFVGMIYCLSYVPFVWFWFS